MDLFSSGKTWSEVGEEVISYFRPRVLTGGKLALRGVQMDSMPLSMSDVSDFRGLYKVDPLVCSPSSLVWDEAMNLQDIQGAAGLNDSQKTFAADFHPEGWAPMVYYNPYNASKQPSERKEMTFLVTMEWRVRFDISNPASSSHVMHKPSTDSEWHSLIQKASNALPGVLDIVERVADTGLRIGAKYGLLN